MHKMQKASLSPLSPLLTQAYTHENTGTRVGPNLGIRSEVSLCAHRTPPGTTA